MCTPPGMIRRFYKVKSVSLLLWLAGEEWFIGSITNNDARTLPVDLSFLPAGKDYVAEIYTDGDKSIPTRTKVRVSKFRVNAKTVLHFNLRASGGSPFV